MKKIESLKKLREIAEQREFAGGKYCIHGKNCAIGHLLKIDGVTDEQLILIDNGLYDWYSIDSVIHEIKKNKENDDFVIKSLINLGFDVESKEEDVDLLRKIQSANDNNELMTDYLDELIFKLEREAN